MGDGGRGVGTYLPANEGGEGLPTWAVGEGVPNFQGLPTLPGGGLPNFELTGGTYLDGGGGVPTLAWGGG